MPADVEPAATILVVEDDDPLRMVLDVILSDHGYVVLAAGHGEEARALAAEHPAPIDALVTDFQLPEMTARELIEAVRAERPGLKVLVISGHPSDGVPGPPLPEDIAFLRKPFSDVALLESVEQLLERGPRIPA